MNSRIQTMGRANWIVVALSLLAATAGVVLFWKLSPKLAASAVGVLVFMTLAVARPVLALALLCAVMPVEGIASTNMQMTEVRLIGIGALVVWVAHMILYRKPVRFNRTFLLGAALVAWAGLSVVWGTQFSSTGARFFTLVQVLVLLLLSINVIETETDFRIVLAGFFIGALVTSPLALTVFVQNVIERARAYEAQNPNGYAMLIGIAILSGLYLMQHSRRLWTKALFLLGAVFLAVPLTLAQSRTAWLATFVGLGVMIWYSRNRVRNFLIVIALGAGLLAGLFAAGMVNITLVHRASQVMTMRQTGTSRFDVWMVASNMIADHPLIGVGYSQFPSKFNQYRPATPSIRRDLISNRDPHSTYFSVTAEMGLIGLLLLLAILWSACREERIPPGARPWISDALVAYLMVFSLGGTLLHDKLFWVGLALAAKARFLSVPAEKKESG